MIKKFPNSELYFVSIVFRAIQMIANDIAKIEFRHIKVKGFRSEINNSKISHIINENPNEELTSFEFKKTIVWDLFLYGNAYILKEVNVKTKILEKLILLRPYQVALNIGEKGKNYVVSFENNEKKNYEFDQIIKINYEVIKNSESSSFANMFSTTLERFKNNDDLYEVKKKLHYTKPEQSFIEDKNLDTEVAIIFGIPPQKLGSEVNDGYTSSSEVTKDYINNALTPLIENITQRLTKGILAPNSNEKITYDPRDFWFLYDLEVVSNFINSSNDFDENEDDSEVDFK